MTKLARTEVPTCLTRVNQLLLRPLLLFFDIVSGEWLFQVVKMLWKYIKENNLQDPKDGRTIICDESLRSLFPLESINMFQMNKHLTKHIWPLEDNAGTLITDDTFLHGF